MKVRKVSIRPSKAYRCLHPMHTVLVTCGKVGETNIITLAWAMPTSIEPPLVAMSIRPTRHSYKLIKKTREFVVNIPTMDIVTETLFCGRRSGKTYDKFKETQLTPLNARTVKTFVIEECVAHLECQLKQLFKTGDHSIFVGEIVKAYANEDSFSDEFNMEKVKLIYHIASDKFVTLSDKIVEPPL